MQDMVIPAHVAVILDGNGRWAKEHHVPRSMGHKAGCENLEQIVEDAARLGIQYFTIYGVKSIGDRSKFDQDLIDGLNMLEDVTKENTGMTFVLALNYGSRDEIRRGVEKIAEEVRDGSLAPSEITEEVISAHLDTAGMPDPDLMIRTSGELRLSNYLMWQLAYAELYFTDVYWPDFHKEHLVAAIEEYNRRNRRFGGR